MALYPSPIGAPSNLRVSTSAATPRRDARQLRRSLGVLLVFYRTSEFGFSVGQVPLSKIRQKDGMALRTPSDFKVDNFSKDAKLLLSQIAEAGERGDWQRVNTLYSGYSGTDNPIFNAVMHSAYSCGQYRKGAAVFQRMSNLNITKTPPSYSAALKLHAKLGQYSDVRKIWAETMRTCELDTLLAAARIDAAAAEGDIAAAATVLDKMKRQGLPINIAHVTSAIRACWEAEGHSHNAAKYIFNLLPELNLQPNVATFTCLVGAYMGAPLNEILDAYAHMQKLDVDANAAFVETYLVTVLQKPKSERWEGKIVIEKLRKRSPAHLGAAREALADFKASGIKLTVLCERLDAALQQLLLEDSEPN